LADCPSGLAERQRVLCRGRGDQDASTEVTELSHRLKRPVMALRRGRGDARCRTIRFRRYAAAGGMSFGPSRRGSKRRNARCSTRFSPMGGSTVSFPIIRGRCRPGKSRALRTPAVSHDEDDRMHHQQCAGLIGVLTGPEHPASRSRPKCRNVKRNCRKGTIETCPAVELPRRHRAANCRRRRESWSRGLNSNLPHGWPIRVYAASTLSSLATRPTRLGIRQSAGAQEVARRDMPRASGILG